MSDKAAAPQTHGPCAFPAHVGRIVGQLNTNKKHSFPGAAFVVVREDEAAFERRVRFSCDPAVRELYIELHVLGDDVDDDDRRIGPRIEPVIEQDVDKGNHVVGLRYEHNDKSLVVPVKPTGHVSVDRVCGHFEPHYEGSEAKRRDMATRGEIKREAVAEFEAGVAEFTAVAVEYRPKVTTWSGNLIVHTPMLELALRLELVKDTDERGRDIGEPRIVKLRGGPNCDGKLKAMIKFAMAAPTGGVAAAGRVCGWYVQQLTVERPALMRALGLDVLAAFDGKDDDDG